MGKRSENYKALEKRLGYRFKNRDLLIEALTHSSATRGTRRVPQNNYERLEFLGDRVLGLVIAELMLESYPDEAEGRIARRLNRLVKRETCADIAREWQVGPYLFLSNGEIKQGGHEKPTILGDVCEAILGAVYLDGDYDTVRALVRRFWSSRMDSDRGSSRDPKSALQEWAQGKGYAPPQYEVVQKDGPDHAPSFSCQVTVASLEPMTGHGSSIREAQQAAARAMLDSHSEKTVAAQGARAE